MRQFAGIIIAFIMLLVMLKGYPKIAKGKKAPLGPVLMITGLIMAVISGLSISTMGQAFVDVFTTFSSLQTLIVVVEIGILANILKQYGLLNKVVRALEKLIPSKKTLIIMFPALMGLLPVPGGAFLSAPFVDSLGNDLKMSGEKKAAANLYFRHIAMFILPYNSTMLAIASALPEISIYKLIGLNLPFMLTLLIGAYCFYVKAAPSAVTESSGFSLGPLKDVFLYLAPIYMAVVFNTVFHLDMYISLLLCILLTFFLIGKDKSEYIKTIVKGFSIDTFLMLAGVYFMQNIILNLDYVMVSVGGILSGQSILGFMIIVPLVGLAFGLSTGMNLVPMGILLPFVAGMNLPVIAQTVYAMYILVWSFLGYYFSPFHLCQLLSIKYMGCDTKKVYRQHLKMMPILCIAVVILFLIYNMILL
ncbi:MAG: DUF401 family protein [Lachnospiraceae bacterium]|nr:DUF401 family protein [Lachnospiraceae bacterium]